MPKVGPNLNIEHVLVCDDIRREDSGKQLLIGVYGSNIIVSKFPASLALAFLLRGTAKQIGVFPFEMRLVFHGGSVLAIGSGKIKVKKANKLFSAGLPPMPINFNRGGKFKVQIREVGARWKTIQETEIKQKP